MLKEMNTLLIGLLPLLAIPVISAFEMNSTSYSVDSFHQGAAGNNASTSSYTLRSTMTYEQGGNSNATTANYLANLGWFNIGTSAQAVSDPAILSTSITPYAVINGSEVKLYINAANISAVWANITLPNGTAETLTLTNNADTSYSNTNLTGRYNVTFYANNSIGTVVNAADYFETFPFIIFNVTVIDYNSTGVNSTWAAYYRNRSVATDSSSNGNYSNPLIDTIVDMEFKAYADRLQVLLRGINASLDNNKQFGMDRHNEISGFLVTYGINSTYTMTNATVKIYYDDLASDDNLQLHKCNDYNFTARTCSGSWTDVTNQATQNTADDYFEIDVASFSGFSVKEVYTPPPPSGGGGGCKSDWICTAWSACTPEGLQTRTCRDMAHCDSPRNKPEESRPCTYVLPVQEEIPVEEAVPEVEPEIPLQLFDIRFEIDEHRIQNSDELSATVVFESFGSEPTPVNLTFIILNEAGDEIYREGDYIVVRTEEILTKKFEGLDLENGRYTLVLHTLYNVDVFDEFRQEFEIAGERNRSVEVALVVLIGMAAIIGLYIRRKKRQRVYGGA